MNLYKLSPEFLYIVQKSPVNICFYLTKKCQQNQPKIELSTMQSATPKYLFQKNK